MMTALIFSVLIFLMILGLPIAVSMGLTAVIFFVVLGQADILLMIPARMYSSSTGFTLLAIPFFILVGNLMNTGGMTHRIFLFCQRLVGSVQGGLGHVNVVKSMIFAGMSGSAVADAGGVGMVGMEAMTKAGFHRPFSAAVTAASATIGPIIPPSIPFVIFGGLTGTSVGRLFLGGFIPGFLMGLGIMITVYFISGRRQYPRQQKSTFQEILAAGLGAWSAYLAPIIIIGGILVGVFTPTEASIVATLYALFVTIIIYREIKIRDLPKVLWITVEQTVRVMFIISTAGLFGWLLIRQKVPEAVIQGLTAMSPDPFMILLIINVILLVLGCFMEAISVMLLTTPIFMPLVLKLGIDPVHFGVVMTFNLMVALLTPPVGMVLYTVSSVGKVPLWELASELKWYFVALMVSLFLITYIPELVTWIPNLVMGKET
ncbi:MAG: TRAP transporter large permease [Deltaproteobacteria bacterium]|jgi:C4-dicarboxylate transporter DctM subunit|nr:TRAP transporter large permease [Deltaproteobacteria bacterium]